MPGGLLAPQRNRVRLLTSGHETGTDRVRVDLFSAAPLNKLTLRRFGAPEEIRTPDPQIRSLVLT